MSNQSSIAAEKNHTIIYQGKQIQGMRGPYTATRDEAIKFQALLLLAHGPVEGNKYTVQAIK